MHFTKLVPNIFYSDIKTGLRTFVECLGFEIGYNDPEAEQPFYVVERDSLKLHLIGDPEFAEKDRPELRLETTDIQMVYDEVSARFPDLLHPNLNQPTVRPWSATEFALRDESGVCIVIQQWPL